MVSEDEIQTNKYYGKILVNFEGFWRIENT